MAQIVWTMRAADDLEEIAQYIARDNREAAGSLVKRVLASVDHFVEFPFMGRMVPELQRARYREVIVYPCRVIYTPEKDAVIIQRIIRGERKIGRDILSA